MGMAWLSAVGLARGPLSGGPVGIHPAQAVYCRLVHLWRTPRERIVSGYTPNTASSRHSAQGLQQKPRWRDVSDAAEYHITSWANCYKVALLSRGPESDRNTKALKDLK
ncbi:unnamed protein product [Lota lota]